MCLLVIAALRENIANVRKQFHPTIRPSLQDLNQFSYILHYYIILIFFNYVFLDFHQPTQNCIAKLAPLVTTVLRLSL